MHLVTPAQQHSFTRDGQQALAHSGFLYKTDTPDNIFSLHLLVVGPILVCPLVNALQGFLMEPGCHIRRAWEGPGGLCAHRMLQDLWQVLRGEPPEQVAALEQLVADLHGMVAHLHTFAGKIVQPWQNATPASCPAMLVASEGCIEDLLHSCLSS